MPSSEPPFPSTPTETAGLLLVARRFAEAHGLPGSSVDQILAATGASRESALESEAAILAVLPVLEQPVSPCGNAPAVDGGGRVEALIREAFRFAMRNPGCARRNARGRCSASYRQFVIELRARYAEVPVSEFADVVDVPPSTLEAWMRSRSGMAVRAAQPTTSPR